MTDHTDSFTSSVKPIPIVLALFILYFAYTSIALYLRRRQYIRDHGCEEPPWLASKDPILFTDIIRENLRAGKERKTLETFRNRFERTGTTFRQKLFGRPMVSTCDPENVKTILSVRFKEFCLGKPRMNSLGPLFGAGIFTTDGEPWAHSRTMIRPNFTRDQVADITAFERHVQKLIKAIPKDGSTVDLQTLFFRLTIDSATEFLFGTSVGSLDAPMPGVEGEETQDFAWAFTYGQDACIKRLRMGSLAKIVRSDPLDLKARKIVHEFTDKFVDDAVEYQQTHPDEEKGKHEGQYVFLHELAKSTTDRRRLRDELLNVLLAGRDTTASLLSNMFFMIAQKPEIWNKLRDEIAFLDGRPPTYEELRNLKYLKYCMNESLRLHPVVPGNFRQALHDTTLPTGGGPTRTSPIFITAGTIVNYSVFTMQRRTDIYGPDAESFVPERWEKLRPGWEYLPFNGGPRICLGQQYALTEAGYTSVRLLQAFAACESRDAKGGVWEEGLTLTCCSGNGTKVALRAGKEA
ncbi:cytochrome P450 [Aulographum hederae CBS 113979]|uniref:Cytochrome P450 n=1 Tax=Aulographum hederae CBS 113979 TaxID=1176131 RepID=A0A6G1H1G2_9PEZI|nr:cytochrome P450 [Aulographum hederae CBS 113979]